MDKFTFFPSYWEAIKDLPDEIRLQCTDAILSYGVTGEEPDVEGFAATVFLLVRPNIDASAKKRAAGRSGGARKADAEREQTANKAEAERKQNGSRTEAERKQTASDKEYGIGNREKEYGVGNREYGVGTKEKEKGEGSKESGVRSVEEGELERELESLPEGVQRTTREWIAYKRERRESYKPTGMKALIRKIRDETSVAGEEKVISVIESSMSSGYQGIVWDRLERAAPRRTRGDEQNDVLIAMMEGRA